VHWMGDTERFAGWCRQADPDALERALRAVPAIYWPSLRSTLREAVSSDGPFHPRVAAFEAVDDAMREALGEGNGAPAGQMGLGLS
jgi:hypothetical protein